MQTGLKDNRLPLGNSFSVVVKMRSFLTLTGASMFVRCKEGIIFLTWAPKVGIKMTGGAIFSDECQSTSVTKTKIY